MAGKGIFKPNWKRQNEIHPTISIWIPLEHRSKLLQTETFWSLCSYMIRKKCGIELLVNLINISYYAMKILPFQDVAFSEYQDKRVQEFRFALSTQIREQVFYAQFVKNIENSIKSNWLVKALKLLIQQQGYYFFKL